ncbi:TetR family transcriptional regulator [Sciscionella marina]|uniref:TetR family transcriptional regulator n=1 Tax=Sciscionella marina TaxID=508770 RepID=UPI000374CC5C|nr:TetR family transcriptional regulator [Sciscionella marina]
MDNRNLSLTERRKAATRLDIAQVAFGLLADHGPGEVTAEGIAGAAGVSLRTFYRYFRSKEDAVAPALAVGGDMWRARLADTPGGARLLPAVEEAIRGALTPQDTDQTDRLERTRRLLRAAAKDSSLAEVWYRVNRESETLLVPVLAGIAAETGELELRLVAAAATDAIRVALEAWAAEQAEADSPAELAVRCFRRLAP